MIETITEIVLGVSVLGIVIMVIRKIPAVKEVRPEDFDKAEKNQIDLSKTLNKTREKGERFFSSLNGSIGEIFSRTNHSPYNNGLKEEVDLSDDYWEKVRNGDED